MIGSRSVRDRAVVYDAINNLKGEYDFPPALIVSGGAAGVDTFAKGWADSNGIPTMIIKPDYDKFPPKIAPKIRNEEIVKNCDVLLAIWDGISGGTANAIAWAAYHNKLIEVVHAGY